MQQLESYGLSAAAGGSYRPGDPPRHNSRLSYLRGGRSPASMLSSLALKGVRVGGYLDGPPAKATAGNANGSREVRAMGQFVGSGPAELEQRADVIDADQPVRGLPSKDSPRTGGRTGFRNWEGHVIDGKQPARGSQ